jgi:ribosome-associated translation inhibitor RaiA
MNRLEIEKKIKYWEKMRDFYTANDRQKKRIQREINKYKKLLIEV